MEGGAELANVIPLNNDFAPIDISPLEALLGEIRRTAGKIVWLETIVGNLKLNELFGDEELIEQFENEGGRMGRVEGVGAQQVSRTERVKWLLANERQRTQTQVRKRPGIHPAVTLLMQERKHLVDCSARALAIGIKLDHIELSQRQGEQMLAGMITFAELIGADVDDDKVKVALATAIDRISKNSK